MISSISSVSLTGQHDFVGLGMTVAITNLRAFERRFPRDIAPAVDFELVERFKEVVDDPSTVLRMGPGCIRVVNVLETGVSLSGASRYIESVLHRIAVPGGLLSLAVLDVIIERTDGRLGARMLRIPASEGRRHLVHAGHVLNAMGDGHLAFSCEPVFNVDHVEQSQYDECLARIIFPEVHCAMMPSSFIPSVTRSGFINEFDRIVVSDVINRLIADSSRVLGCNISAESAIESHWWTATFDRLARMPEVARRLVIEITETAPVVPERGRAFAQHLSALGCRIAIDDFGAGYGVQNGIAIGEPDIVKLDAGLLENARSSEAGVERLRGLADLARDLAHTVVIEGVESREDLDIVRRAGCEWAQGHFRCGTEDIALHGLIPLPPV